MIGTGIPRPAAEQKDSANVNHPGHLSPLPHPRPRQLEGSSSPVTIAASTPRTHFTSVRAAVSIPLARSVTIAVAAGILGGGALLTASATGWRAVLLRAAAIADGLHGGAEGTCCGDGETCNGSCYDYNCDRVDQQQSVGPTYGVGGLAFAIALCVACCRRGETTRRSNNSLTR